MGNPVAAVSFAELAVTADLQNTAARSALAKAYQSAGRFRSAADAYGDIVAMNPQDSYSRFRAALVTLAAGDRRAALTALDGLATTPALAADVGLALALAGETNRAVDLLVKTVRSGDSTPRVRQNLALAQALAGEWAAARVSASIDLSPDLVDARVAEWAALASNKDSAWRTATVLGVGAAVSDAGRPVQLAWAAPQPATTQFAEATTVEAPAVKVEQFAVIAPAPAQVVVAKTEPVIRPEPVKITKVELPAMPKPLVFDGVPSSKPEAKPAKPVHSSRSRPWRPR